METWTWKEINNDLLVKYTEKMNLIVESPLTDSELCNSSMLSSEGKSFERCINITSNNDQVEKNLLYMFGGCDINGISCSDICLLDVNEIFKKL
jgi:hypothetical protein